jgi:hypothetical protein
VQSGQQSIIGPSPSFRQILQKQRSPTEAPQTKHLSVVVPSSWTARAFSSLVEFIWLFARRLTVPRERVMIFSFVAGSLEKSFESGQNGFLARGSDDAEAGLSLDKIDQGWNGLNLVIKAEIETVVRVNLHDLYFSGEVARHILKHGLGDPTRPAPTSPEFNQHRQLRFQDFRFEVQGCDSDGLCFVFSIRVFGFVRHHQISGTTRAK